MKVVEAAHRGNQGRRESDTWLLHSAAALRDAAALVASGWYLHDRFSL